MVKENRPSVLETKKELTRYYDDMMANYGDSGVVDKENKKKGKIMDDVLDIVAERYPKLKDWWIR